MIIRIVGLILAIFGAGLVSYTLVTGAVPTGLFVFVMIGLVLTVAGTILTSDSLHIDKKED